MELRTGTGPLSGDAAPGPVAGPPDDDLLTPLGAIARASGFYEAPLPKTRPYVESVESRSAVPDDLGVFRATELTEIDIDAEGSGTYSSFVETRNEMDEDVRRATLEAVRPVGGGVERSGIYEWSVSSAGLWEDLSFTTRTRAVDGRISQRGTIEWVPRSWARSSRTEVEFDPLGQPIEGSPLCEPVAGQVAFVEETVQPCAPRALGKGAVELLVERHETFRAAPRHRPLASEARAEALEQARVGRSRRGARDVRLDRLASMAEADE